MNASIIKIALLAGALFIPLAAIAQDLPADPAKRQRVYDVAFSSCKGVAVRTADRNRCLDCADDACYYWIQRAFPDARPEAFEAMYLYCHHEIETLVCNQVTPARPRFGAGLAPEESIYTIYEGEQLSGEGDLK